MIIIITAPTDGHLSYVTTHLKTTEYVRIDIGDIIAGKNLTYSLDHSGLKIKYGAVELENITGVWYRRPRNSRDDLELNVHPNHEGYAYSSLFKFMEQLYVMFDEANWVSDFYAIRRADNKLLQLRVARDLGFPVPETIFTSAPDDARRFIAQRRRAIVKSLATYLPLPTIENHRPAFFSQILNSDTSSNYEGLNFAPAIFQQLIEPKFELRVTVVGDEVFAAKVTMDQSKKNIRDWRLGHSVGGLSIESYDLPENLSKKCVSLTKKLGLNFGALDLIQAKDGTVWFLEINPNGQWAFVEQATGQPIGKALARFLQRKRGL